LYYSTNGGVSFSDALTQTEFKALPISTFDSCASLKIRVQPIGTETVSSVAINSVSTSIIQTKIGSVTHTVSGVDVYKVESDGDVAATDISCDDITMTGSLSASGEVIADGFRPAVVSITSNESPYSLSLETETVFANCAGEITVNVPSAATKIGKKFRFRKTGGTANLNLDADGSETIHAMGTYVMGATTSNEEIDSDGANWW